MLYEVITLVLLEAPVEQVDLHREGVALGVAVEVVEVLVVDHRLVVDVEVQVLGEGLGQGGLAGADEARDADEQILKLSYNFV